MKPLARQQFFDKLAQSIPDPTTELNYSTTFELLIAVILSAQATDKGVNRATEPLFKIANTPTAIFKLGEETLKQHIKTIGLFNSKASNIIKTCEILVNEFNSEVPDNREDLQRLPGVGRKTANVILNTAFGQLAMAVDTHIFRVSNRTGLAPGKTPLAVELKLLKNVPQQHLLDAHHLLILHGRYICTARKPKCQSCVVADECAYYAANSK